MRKGDVYYSPRYNEFGVVMFDNSKPTGTWFELGPGTLPGCTRVGLSSWLNDGMAVKVGRL